MFWKKCQPSATSDNVSMEYPRTMDFCAIKQPGARKQRWSPASASNITGTQGFRKASFAFIWYLYKTSFDLIVVEADGSKWEGREGVRQCSAERVPPRLRSKLLLKISLSTFISWSTTRRSYKSLLMQWIAGERQAGVDRTSNQSPTPTDSAILSTASSATSGTSSALSLGAKARISIGVILGVGCVVLAVV